VKVRQGVCELPEVIQRIQDFSQDLKQGCLTRLIFSDQGSRILKGDIRRADALVISYLKQGEKHQSNLAFFAFFPLRIRGKLTAVYILWKQNITMQLRRKTTQHEIIDPSEAFLVP
jgi:hypothetical protein